MESDISLIEVAREDDSLLQQIPEHDLHRITAGSSDYFTCSPLLTARSNGRNAISSTVPSTDCTEKGNNNANNFEEPKLSILPQTMKRKKKAGGYNLRKSIAWNKAFFTEEGVLNPLELSIITGSSSGGEALTSIDEETPAISGGDCCNDLSLEDKVLKDASSSALNKDRKNNRGLFPKRASSTKDMPASAVKLKEPSAKDVNQSGSKRGKCPRPLTSLSAKRHTTLNTTKTVKREEKASRIPVPKRDPTVLSRAQKSSTIRASDTKGNQVAQKVGSYPKKTTSKDASINTKSALKNGNESKSLKAKTLIQQSRKKMVSAGPKMDSSHLQREPASDSDKGLQVATNSSFLKCPSNDHDGTKKVSSFFPCPLDGENMLYQIQKAKPSGLRMPSPSMGFFAQKKVTSFQSPLPNASQPYDLSKSNIPSLRSAGLSNPIRELPLLGHGNSAIAGNSEASGETNNIPCLSSCSPIRPTSHDRVEPILEAINRLQGEVNVADASTNKDLSAQGVENDLGSQSMPRVLVDRLKRPKDENEQSSEQVEYMNSSSCTLKQISSDQRLETRTSNSLKRSRTSKEFEHVRLEENVSNGSHTEEGRASYKDMSEGQDEALETHQIRISSTRDAEASDIGCCISNEDNKTLQNTSESYNLDLMHIDDEKSEFSMLNSNSLQENSFSQTSQHSYGPHSNEAFAGESSGVCGYELQSNINIDHCLIPYSAEDSCLNSGPVFKNCNYHTDNVVDIRTDTKPDNICLDLDVKEGRDDLAISCNIAESLPIVRDLCTVETESQHCKPQSCAVLEHMQNKRGQTCDFLSSVDELQDHCTDFVEVSQHNDKGKCLNGDLLHTSDASEEYKEESIADDVVSLHEETHDIRTDDQISEALVAAIRSPKCSTAESSKYDKSLCGEAASVTMSNETISEAGTTCNDSTFCSMTEELGLSVTNDHMSRVSVEQFIEAKELENHEILQIDGNSLRQNEVALNNGMQHRTETETCSTDDNNAEVQLEKSGDVGKENAVVVKSSTNAVPFSDEWLAAIEAAGEEVLTMKSGAVQNSPPDKFQPEPGPWSPVKRKNNQGIGPFDCTKCTYPDQPHES